MVTGTAYIAVEHSYHTLTRIYHVRGVLLTGNICAREMMAVDTSILIKTLPYVNATKKNMYVSQ